MGSCSLKPRVACCMQDTECRKLSINPGLLLLADKHVKKSFDADACLGVSQLLQKRKGWS